jgi:hypothetical protein
VNTIPPNLRATFSAERLTVSQKTDLSTMCFSANWTLAFALFSTAVGSFILAGKWIWNIARWRRVRISLCFFWFALMEALQYVQYLVINQCSNEINRIFTGLGWVHIAFQPFFSNLALSALDKLNLEKQRSATWRFVLDFCAAGGFLMSLRWLIPAIFPASVAHEAGKTLYLELCTTRDEGICSTQTCATTGIWHIRWDFLLLKPSYPFPGISFHLLCMFVAPALLGEWLASIVLFLSGPGISLLFKGIADGERSAIWCFFSIAETVVTVTTQWLLIRKSASKSNES